MLTKIKNWIKNLFTWQFVLGFVVGVFSYRLISAGAQLVSAVAEWFV